MSASVADIADLRGYVAEPDESTYSHEDLAAVIEKYPIIDADGNEPDDAAWTATYDLNAAAANIWGRKASAMAAMYDFSADGGKFTRSQLYQQAKEQARYYGSRRMPASFSVQTPKNYERDYQSTYAEDATTDGYVINSITTEEDE